MIGAKTRSALLAGQTVRGAFWIAGSAGEAAGTLTWSYEDGAEIQLIGASCRDWPPDFDASLTVHCLVDGGSSLTLMDAVVRTISLGDRVTRLTGRVLALGMFIDSQQRWSRAIYSTANLSEWLSETGLQYHRGDGRADQPKGMLWAPPPRHEFRLPRADVAITGEVDADPVGVVPEWSIRTWRSLEVDVRRRQTASQLYDSYALPLLTFTVFASDRPDSITREILLNPGQDERVEMLRTGPQVQPREWRLQEGYLFRAHELPRLATGLRKWWRLHQSLLPALDLFAEHVNAGNAYSSARFLTMYTAMEAYCRERHRRKDFKLLRDYAAVDEAAHGCGLRELAMIGVSRDYLSHLNLAGPFSRQEITDTIHESTRRASALMQACLLRELGFGTRQIERLLHRHHRNWPIPRLAASRAPLAGS